MIVPSEYSTTSIFDNTTPTNATCDVEINNNNEYVSYTATGYYDNAQLIKSLIKKEIVEKLKSTWNNYVAKFKEPEPIRPDIRLRGVRLDGWGWM